MRKRVRVGVDWWGDGRGDEWGWIGWLSGGIVEGMLEGGVWSGVQTGCRGGVWGLGRDC